jgi:DNA-binding PadR family transcriptional regulator
MYELMILGQLSRRPMHGYMIAKIIGHMMGPFRQVQWGALYPVLTRLEQQGLIRTEESAEPSDGRGRKVYAITPQGEAYLHDLLLDTEHHLNDYATVFPFKVAFFHRLSPQERLRLARHYTVYAQQHIDHLERKRRDLTAPDVSLTSAERDDVLSVMTHGIERWCRERAWGEQLMTQQSIEEAS